jgi:hypothetical protein
MTLAHDKRLTRSRFFHFASAVTFVFGIFYVAGYQISNFSWMPGSVSSAHAHYPSQLNPVF